MFELQRLVLPHLGFGAPEEMYARLHYPCRADLSYQTIHFDVGGWASFDTFFNGLTIPAWKGKCSISDLHLTLSGSGRFSLRFGLHRIGAAHRWLSENEITLVEGTDLTIELPLWSELELGMLYFSLFALEPSLLVRGAFLTSTAPQQEVKLGIVITHFNRKQYVVPALKRISRELLADPMFRGKIDLIVVDNSCNVTEEEASGVTLIPNQNLGGSGGFTRGLIHLVDSGDYTHCLFMDDDASCEIESIRRAYALLSYSEDKKFAVAGCMLRDLEPFRLYEKGAKYQGTWWPLKHGMDMNDVNDLLRAEQQDASIDYGGWWFFAFKISDVERYPFPFFVRGDDILFSLQNKFQIFTLNGIACWCEDFVSKEVPLHHYLDMRAMLAISFLEKDLSRVALLKICLHRFMRCLTSYKYASAHAVTIAMMHILSGPDFFVKNLDTSKIRSDIAKISTPEAKHSVIRAEFDVAYGPHNETRIRYWIRQLTLNGFLLPSFLLKDAYVFQPMSWRAIPREIFRFKRIYFESESIQIGYTAEHDKISFFKELGIFLATVFKLLFRMDKIRKEFRDYTPLITSLSFWSDVYNRVSH